MTIIQSFNGAVKAAVDRKLAENAARVKLLLCVNDDRVDDILEETRRRTKLFRKQWRSSTMKHDKTARHAAFDSVYNDVVRGYLL